MTEAELSATVAGLHAACELGDVVPGVTASIGIHAARGPVSLVDAMAEADGSLYDEKVTTKAFFPAETMSLANRSAQVDVAPPK